ncbi:MAG: hypothetical protein WDO18_02610 [Acidobacteriota bacterium]
MKQFPLLLSICVSMCAQSSLDLLNHNRPVLDAHNCYPYEGQWADRLDRALSTGRPVAIEQDLAWGKGQPVVSHARDTTGSEPTLKAYFFEHVRPQVEKALRENNRSQWPLITVHFDFKDNRPELHRAVWELLGEYEGWITTAPKTADANKLSPFDVKPLLVLTEDNDAQEEVFFKSLPVGAKLRLFGSAHTAVPANLPREERAHWAVTVAPEALLTEHPTTIAAGGTIRGPRSKKVARQRRANGPRLTIAVCARSWITRTGWVFGFVFTLWTVSPRRRTAAGVRGTTSVRERLP